MPSTTRREFLQIATAVAAPAAVSFGSPKDDFAPDEIGVTCATLGTHMKPRVPDGFSLTH